MSLNEASCHDFVLLVIISISMMDIMNFMMHDVLVILKSLYSYLTGRDEFF